MDLKTLKELLASLNINPDEIEDERYATAFRILFASIEKQNEEIELFKAENQKLRDKINLLKGEQTKPKIRVSKKSEDISSENERRKRRLLQDKKSKSKLDKIEIHRIETCKVDRSISPSDAYSKGYRDVVIQDISIKPMNTNYKIEIFYSPSEHKTYSGELPGGIKGEFGPGIRSLVITLNHIANVSERLSTKIQ